MYNQRYTNINTQPAISEHEYMNIDVLLTDFDVVFQSVCGTGSFLVLVRIRLVVFDSCLF